jgi:hypothetical protein
VGAFFGGVLGTAIGVQQTLLIMTIAPLLSVLWLIWSPVIRQRALPEPAEPAVEASEAEEVLANHQPG